MPKRSQVLLNGNTFRLKDRHAFIMEPETLSNHESADNKVDKPWIFYAPTLSAYPDKAESWMHQKFLDAGIAVAGIDVGEAYGSPKAFSFFEALYKEMANRGYSKKPALLGRSRGGLWVSSWAVDHPDRVAAIGGSTRSTTTPLTRESNVPHRPTAFQRSNFRHSRHNSIRSSEQTNLLRHAYPC